MAVKNLKPYWSVGKISFVTDVIIILLGGFLLRDVDGIIYGMIVSFLLAIVVDRLMYGINFRKDDTCRDGAWKGDLRCDRFLLRPRLYDITGTGRLPL